ncbi:MAG: Photosystem I assembly protein Ycf3 [Candidatus Anoxychlamydiales bacterium]|nr:Photosystem I assembly protein Ycf3 [Candidatus Anoxychlamydiales bacterium]
MAASSISSSRFFSASEDRLDQDEEVLKRIAETFKFSLDTVETYAEAEELCFQTVLQAGKEKKWNLIDVAQQDIAKITDVAGRTLLMHTVADWNEDLTTELSLRFKYIALQKDLQGNTALHIAAKTGSSHLIEELLKCLDLEARNNKGEAPIHTAILSGQETVLAMFIKKGANRNLLFKWNNLEVKPLLLAVIRGEVGCINLLLNEKNFRQNISNIGNILHLAIYFNQPHVLEYLFTDKKTLILPLLEDQDNKGLTPFALAASLGDIQSLWILKEQDANLNTRDEEGKTPLHHAALNFQLNAIEFLSFFGASLTRLDNDGNNPLSLVQEQLRKMGTLPEIEFTVNLLKNLSRARQTRAPQRTLQCMPENLIFKGGGPKGIAYAGVLQALESRSLLKSVKRVAGTSAGAITAVLIALGYSPQEVKKLLFETNLMTFLDHPFSAKHPKSFSGSSNGETGNILKKLSYVLSAITTAVGNPLSTLLGVFEKLYTTTGLCEGETFRKWIEETIASKTEEITKTRIGYLTFKELRQLIVKYPTLKHFHAYGTKIGRNPEIVHFSSEDPACDDYIISDIIRISMSIPGVFKPHCIHIKKGPHRVAYKEAGSFVDGGLLYNLPVEAFDQKRYQTKEDLGEEGLCPKFNRRTLAFSLSSSSQASSQESNIETIGQLLLGVANAYYNAETLLRQLNPYNQRRVIEIDPGDVSTLSFNLDDEGKRALFETGFKTTESFFSKALREAESSTIDFATPAHIEKKAKGRIRLQSPHPHFTGRDFLLSQLQSGFIRKGWKSTDPIIVQVLRGPAGIGKSELAINFGNKDLDHFSLVWFIHTESEFLYNQDYYDLAVALNIPLDKDSPELIRKKVHTKLEDGIDSKKPYLLILDNVETHLDIPSRGGCVLMTTKREDVGANKKAYIDVPPFSIEESKALFQRILTKKVPSQEMLEALYKQLEGFPFLLEKVANYIQNTKSSFEEFMQQISNKTDEMLWEKDEKSRYPSALGMVFKNILIKLEKDNTEAYQFLRFAAFLNPDHIPLSFLKFWLKEIGQDVDKVKPGILQALINSSLVRYNEETEAFSIHRITKSVLQKEDLRRNKELFDNFLTFFAKWVEGFEEDQPQTWTIGEGCTLQIEDLERSLFWEVADAEQKSLLFSIAGNWLRVKGEAQRSLYYDQKALVIRKKVFGEEHPHVATSYNNIGGSLGDLGRYEEALEYLQKALVILKKVFGEEHPHVATSYNNIGNSLGELGRHEEGLKYDRKALVIQKKVFGEEHPDVARSYNNIGNSLGDLGRHEEALKYHQKALAIQKKVFGEEHPYIAISYNNIGISLGELGRHEEALEYKQKALVIQKKVFGEEHPDVASSYTNIGASLGDLGRHEEALEYYQKALVIQKKVFGEEHPDVASSYNNIGSSLGELGRHEEGLEYQQKALVILKKVFSEEHPDVALSYNNIGASLEELGRPEEALEYYQKALVIRKKVFSEEHPDVAFSYDNIGASLGALGRNEKGLKYKQIALVILKKVFGEEHPDVAFSYNNIGNSLGDLGRHEEALEYYQKALVIEKKVFGEEHPHVARSYNNIGASLGNLGRHEEALEYEQKALVIQKKVFGEEHPNVATSYNNIGISLGDLGRHEEALKYFQKAFIIVCNIFELEHPNQKLYLENLVQCLRKIKDKQQRKSIQQEILVLCIKKFGEDDALTKLIRQALDSKDCKIL